MGSDESTFKPALTLMSGRVAAFAITFVTPVILVRVFTQSEFGTYKQLLLMTYTLFFIAQCGLAESLFYFLPKNPDRAGRYALNAVVMLFVSGLVCAAGLLANPRAIASWMSNPALVRYMPVIAAYLVFMLMGTVLEITMISCKRYKLAAATYVSSDLLRAFFLVMPALLTGSLMWALMASVLFLFLRVCAIFGYFRWEFNGPLHLDKDLLKEQCAYA